MGVELAQANGLTIAYEAIGDPAAPPLLLIHGLGRQLIGWHDDFCMGLADRGLRVVRFDNRDAGESTHLHDAPRFDLMACLNGDTSSAPYTLSDMAADTAGLLDALAIDRAHVAGASLGGMIAQTLAIEHPERVRSLTSIMSTTGEPGAAEATPEASAILLQAPPRDRAEAVERMWENTQVIGSPGFELDEAWIRESAGRAFDRGFDPPGVGRQLAAVYASGDRTAGLRALRVPTLVIHGEEDPLIPISGGRATAAAIDGAQLQAIPGMGHDMPRGVWRAIIDGISAVVERAERERVPAAQ